MSSTLTAPFPLTHSRPKVHRLPDLGRGKNAATPESLSWGVALLVLAMLPVLSRQQPVIKEATLLPVVAVVSNRISSAAQAQNEAAEAPGILSGSLMDAQAASVAPPVYTTVEKPANTIVLKDKSGVIVGQMAKIPFENEQITEVKAINEVDNGGGRELLSIVNKY